MQSGKTERYATYTLPEFIAEVTVSGKTSDSSFENLLPEGTYYAFAVCVANDGTCISEATVETIRTSESPKILIRYSPKSLPMSLIRL